MRHYDFMNPLDISLSMYLINHYDKLNCCSYLLCHTVPLSCHALGNAKYFLDYHPHLPFFFFKKKQIQNFGWKVFQEPSTPIFFICLKKILF